MTQVRGDAAGEPFAAAVRRGQPATRVELDAGTFDVEVKGEGAQRHATVGGRAFVVERRGASVLVDGEPFGLRLDSVAPGEGRAEAAGAAAARVRPPMTGRLVSLGVAAGQSVRKGDVLFVLEAMKMQNEVRAPVSGVVKAVHAQPGAAVETSQVILEIG